MSTDKKTGDGECERCKSCDKNTCDTFADVASRKGQDFADTWWDKKEEIARKKAEKDPPAPPPQTPEDPAL